MRVDRLLYAGFIGAEHDVTQISDSKTSDAHWNQKGK
jgi:hypothetical protein